MSNQGNPPVPPGGYSPQQGGYGHPQGGYGHPQGGYPQQQPPPQQPGYPPQGQPLGGYGQPSGYQQPGEFPQAGHPGQNWQGQPYNQPPKKGRGGLFIGIGVGVLVLVVAIVASLMFLGNRSTDSAASSSPSAGEVGDDASQEASESSEGQRPEEEPSADMTIPSAMLPELDPSDFPQSIGKYKLQGQVTMILRYSDDNYNGASVLASPLPYNPESAERIMTDTKQIAGGKGVCGSLESTFSCQVQHSKYNNLHVTGMGNITFEEVLKIAEAVQG